MQKWTFDPMLQRLAWALIVQTRSCIEVLKFNFTTLTKNITGI